MEMKIKACYEKWVIILFFCINWTKLGFSLNLFIYFIIITIFFNEEENNNIKRKTLFWVLFAFQFLLYINIYIYIIYFNYNHIYNDCDVI